MNEGQENRYHESDSQVMRAVKVFRVASGRSDTPTAYEKILGALMILVGLGAGALMIFHAGHGHVPTAASWTFVGICFAFGGFLFSPVRTRDLIHEIRRSRRIETKE